MAKFGKYTLHLFITTHSLRRMMKKFDLFFEIDKHTSNSEKKIQFLKKVCIGNDLIDIYRDYPLRVFQTFLNDFKFCKQIKLQKINFLDLIRILKCIRTCNIS